MKRSIALLAGIATGAVAYTTLARPLHLRWGSTKRERERIWAGDELMPNPVTQSTRVVTIHAPAEHVWPWIAQLGQDRGGFYSYTPLENFIGAEMQNADEIHPDWHDRDVGEKLWLGAPDKFEGKAFMRVARWIPGRALILVSPGDWDRICDRQPAEQSVWSLIVEPECGKKCRLIARSLGGPDPEFGGKIAQYLFWEPAHFIMERGMMLGIKHRAEAGEPHRVKAAVMKLAHLA